MSWATRIDDLRAILSDGATDKLRHRKRVFGKQDSANTRFKTFEFRRVTDFSAFTPGTPAVQAVATATVTGIPAPGHTVTVVFDPSGANHSETITFVAGAPGNANESSLAGDAVQNFANTIGALFTSAELTAAKTGPTVVSMTVGSTFVGATGNGKITLSQVSGAFALVNSTGGVNAGNHTGYPLGVYVDGSYVQVSSDFPEVGEFILSSAPANGAEVEASYYVQWFKDAELTAFFRNAVQWLNLGDDADAIPSVLRPAALQYTAADAYQKMAVRWTEYLSETYRLEDAADEKNKALLAEYREMEASHRKEARKLRDDYYSRAGQNLEPKTGAVSGRVSGVVPRR